MTSAQVVREGRKEGLSRDVLGDKRRRGNKNIRVIENQGTYRCFMRREAARYFPSPLFPYTLHLRLPASHLSPIILRLIFMLYIFLSFFLFLYAFAFFYLSFLLFFVFLFFSNLLLYFRFLFLFASFSTFPCPAFHFYYLLLIIFF